MSSTLANLSDGLGQLLLEIARKSIVSGIKTAEPLAVDPLAFPSELRSCRATFVTLHHRGQLRGCVGGLEPRRELVTDVAMSAFAAAFRDHRLPPVSEDELEELEVQISILSVLEALPADSEEALISKLRPRIDGLVLREGARQSTFLPSVWESLPEPAKFLRELKQKAGLAPGYWSQTLEFLRYTVEHIP